MFLLGSYLLGANVLCNRNNNVCRQRCPSQAVVMPNVYIMDVAERCILCSIYLTPQMYISTDGGGQNS